MPLSTRVSYNIVGGVTKVFGPLTASLEPAITLSAALSSGTGLNQADQVYYSRPTIAGSATLTLDLATGGGLFNVYGDAFAIAKLKLIVVKSELALSPNIISLQRPGAAGVPIFGAAGATMPIHPGGSIVWFAPTLAGVTVTATTADLIELVNTAAGNVQPEIMIVGSSA